MKELLVVISVFILSVQTFGQQDTLLPTQTMSEVEISTLRSADATSPLLTTYRLNKRLTDQQMDLGAWLDQNGLAQINRSGAPGTTASIRFRGLASDHTQLLWNGIPLNSLMLGSCDISLIPVFLFDGLTFSEGSGANTFVTSNIGATLKLINFEGDSLREIKVSSGVNSLLNHHYGIDFRWSAFPSKNSSSFSFRTKAFLQRYENDFSYIDNYDLARPVIEQVHNNGQNRGFTQDVDWNFGSSILSGKIWHQERSVLLPQIMGITVPSHAVQEDEFTRLGLSFGRNVSSHRLQVSYAWNNEYLFWQDNDIAVIESSSRIQSHIAAINVEKKVLKNFMLQASATGFSHSVNTSAYEGGKKNLDIGQTGLTAVYNKNRHSIELAGRKDFREIKTEPAVSFQYYFRNKKTIGKLWSEYHLNASTKFRAPDFNELYWNPGGNPNLVPEKGYNATITGSWKYFLQAKNYFFIKLQAYYNDVDNWIQWQPGAGGIWSPVNIRNVVSKGAEVNAGLHFSYGKSEFEIHSRAEYLVAQGKNTSGDAGTKWFDMIYTPRWRASNTIDYSVSSWTASFSHQYNGKRFTDDSNNPYRALKAYHLFNLRIGKTGTFAHTPFEAGFSVDNIFNKQYESVRAYAMPGRVFSIHLKINIQFK